MLPRLTPIDWGTLVKIFEAEGFVHSRTRGSHCVLTKDGVLRPIVIPKYDEISPDIIMNNLRSAGISRDRYFELLGSKKTAAKQQRKKKGEKKPQARAKKTD